MDIVIIAKAIGFIAFIITLNGYLSKSDDKLRLAVAVSAGLLSLHYFMMFAWMSGVCLAINFVRNQIAVFKKGLPYFYFFSFIQIVIAIALYKKAEDLIPVVGSLISGYALFCEKGVRFRGLMLLCTLCWLVNNLMLKSYGASMQDGLSIIMNIFGIIRIKRSEQT